jgi:hypothetical protein
LVSQNGVLTEHFESIIQEFPKLMEPGNVSLLTRELMLKAKAPTSEPEIFTNPNALRVRHTPAVEGYEPPPGTKVASIKPQPERNDENRLHTFGGSHKQKVRKYASLLSLK